MMSEDVAVDAREATKRGVINPSNPARMTQKDKKKPLWNPSLTLRWRTPQVIGPRATNPPHFPLVKEETRTLRTEPSSEKQGVNCSMYSSKLWTGGRDKNKNQIDIS